jgi:hypothetical protein
MTEEEERSGFAVQQSDLNKHGSINLWREDKKIWSTHIFFLKGGCIKQCTDIYPKVS